MNSIRITTDFDQSALANTVAKETSLSSESSQAVAATLSLLSQFQSDPSLFVPSRLLLLPPHASFPDDNIAACLYELALSAEAAAISLASSSILAGQGSEGDDTGDVSFWLGDGDFGPVHASNVVKSLQLDRWTQEGKISFDQFAVANTNTETGNLVTYLDKMQMKYTFHVSLPQETARVIFILVGHMGTGWGGLLGIGVWSEGQ